MTGDIERFQPSSEAELASDSSILEGLFTNLANVPAHELAGHYRRAINRFHLELAQKALEMPEIRPVEERLAGLRLASSALEGLLSNRPYIGAADETLDQAQLGIKWTQIETKGRQVVDNRKVLESLFPIPRLGESRPAEKAVERSWQSTREMFDPQYRAYPNISLEQLERAIRLHVEAASTRLDLDYLSFHRNLPLRGYAEETLDSLQRLKNSLDPKENEELAHRIMLVETQFRADIIQKCSRYKGPLRTAQKMVAHGQFVFTNIEQYPVLQEEELKTIRQEHIGNLRYLILKLKERGDIEAVSQLEAEMAVHIALLQATELPATEG